MMKTALALPLMMAVCTGATFAGEWQHFFNDRFGAAADIPADYKAGEPPASDDGGSFTSPDGETSIIIFGALATVLDDNFSGYARSLVSYDRNDGWKITYSTGKADWFAFSGSKGDRIFYEKVISACKGEAANHVRIEYPSSRKSEFDPIVAHLTKSLRSQGGYQCKE